MKRLLGGMWILLLLVGRVAAPAAESEFAEANRMYEKGRYAEAATAYQKLVDRGERTAGIYYNLGTAAFKAGQPGRAIAAYRQAERFDPRDADLRANLAFARQKVNGDQVVPVPWWRRGLARLTLNEWSVLAVAAWWGWFGLLLQRQARPEKRAATQGTTWTFGVLAVVTASLLAAATWERLGLKSAVVVVREAVVRFGPLEESQVATQMPDGTELVVLEARGDWLRVEAPNGTAGWVRRNQVSEL